MGTNGPALLRLSFDDRSLSLAWPSTVFGIDGESFAMGVRLELTDGTSLVAEKGMIGSNSLSAIVVDVREESAARADAAAFFSISIRCRFGEVRVMDADGGKDLSSYSRRFFTGTELDVDEEPSEIEGEARETATSVGIFPCTNV